MEPEAVQIEEEFHVSKYIIVYKFILGLIEALIGFGVIFFGKQISREYQRYKVQQLLEDPRDLFLNIGEKVRPYLSKHIRLVIFILILLGVVKMIGAVALVYKKHWGLDLLILLTFLLLPFQSVDLIFHFAPIKIVFLVTDIFIALYLVQFEPRKYFKKMYLRIGKK